MKKILLIVTLLVLSLQAKDFNFDVMPKDVKRITPNSQNEILSFYDSIKDSRKAVVNISTKKRVKSDISGMFNDPFFKDFFGDFFGKGLPKDRMHRSLGSGVVISSDGYIITNNHVIKNADEITVTLPEDKKEYKAKVIGKDDGSDLAVIKIEEKNLTAIKFGHMDDIKVGDIVFAIGNPFGVGESVTQGIVSALNKNKMGINQYENYIQTDASINPGNSGGALVDSRGALIGINTAIMSRSGGNNGIGFAIPIDMVKNIVERLIKDGKVVRGYMGVTIGDMAKDFEAVYKHKQGAVVIGVQKDSAAEKYGIKRGDLIYEIDGKVIKNAYDLQIIIASFKPKQNVEIKLERDKTDKTIKMVLGSRDEDIQISSNAQVLGGLFLSELTKENRYKYRISPTIQGVLITDVEPRSEAERVGFQAGDVIVAIENIDVYNLDDVKKAMSKYKNIAKRVYVNRGNGVRLFVIR